MDLAVAAASAAGETVVLPPKRRTRAVTPPDDDDLLQYDEAEDLPDVDDLEVAAAAAAAAQAALQRAADAPLYAVPQRVLASAPAENMDTDDEDEDEDDDGGEGGVVVALEIVDGQGEVAGGWGPSGAAPRPTSSTRKNSISIPVAPPPARAC